MRIFNTLNGFAIPEPNPSAQWVFSNPTVAQHLGDIGLTLELKRNWFGRKQWWYLPPCGGKPMHVNSSGLWWDLKEALSFKPLNSELKKYTPGQYELVGTTNKRLLPSESIRQLSDINVLELHQLQTEEVFRLLSSCVYHLPIRGVCFREQAGYRKAFVYREDFDWHGIAQSSWSADYGMSELPNWTHHEGQMESI